MNKVVGVQAERRVIGAFFNKNKDYKGKNHIFYVSYVLEAGIA